VVRVSPPCAEGEASDGSALGRLLRPRRALPLSSADWPPPLDDLKVALTGYGRDEDKQKTKAAGFDHHLVKPVDPDVLQDLVSRLGTNESLSPQVIPRGS
jgi:CheY-like chemotaxis protein